MAHPKNRTRYKSLDKIAADPRVDEIWDEGPDGIWVSLVDGLWRESPLELACFHEWTVKDLLAEWKEAEQGYGKIVPVPEDRW